MNIREIISQREDKRTGEIYLVSNIKDGKLYGVYHVISNKTVRENERFCVRWCNKDANIPGKEMVRTNRGYFIDGYNVDDVAVNMWFTMTKNSRNKRK